MIKEEFAQKITQLKSEMTAAGKQYIVHYAWRSPEEQNRLFQEGKGKTKCDGINNFSRHQQFLAEDIYLVVNGLIQWTWDKTEAEVWHNRWMEISGSTQWIIWDAPHFSSDGK